MLLTLIINILYIFYDYMIILCQSCAFRPVFLKTFFEFVNLDKNKMSKIEKSKILLKKTAHLKPDVNSVIFKKWTKKTLP